MALDGTAPNITRWECLRPIGEQTWHLRIVWCAQGPDGRRPSGGRAWFSFGPAGGPLRHFNRSVPELTPDLHRHFIRLVTRIAKRL